MSFRKRLESTYTEKGLIAEEKIHTIIFCDPGLDDALMLLQLFSSPQHIIDGIIPGAGNVPLEQTIKNTLLICGLAGKNIKVYPGCRCPEGQSENEMISGVTVYGDDGLGGIAIPDINVMTAESTNGVDFAVEQIRNRKTLLVSSGGLTDVYRVLMRLQDESPESLQNIIGISMMAGVADKQQANAPIGINRYTEFNILFDPVASKGVFEIAARHQIKIFLAALDLTHSILCSEDDIRELHAYTHPIAKFAYELLSTIPEHYRKRYDNRQPLHDVHASFCVRHPDLYQCEASVVHIDNDHGNLGAMSVVPCQNGNVMFLKLPSRHHKQFFALLMEDIKMNYQLSPLVDLVQPLLPNNIANFPLALFSGTKEITGENAREASVATPAPAYPKK